MKENVHEAEQIVEKMQVIGRPANFKQRDYNTQVFVPHARHNSLPLLEGAKKIP